MMIETQVAHGGTWQRYPQPSPSDSSSHQAHVLAVDDSLVDRKVIETLLKVSSCRVTAVDSGRRALQFLGLDDEEERNSSADVDLIITDYCMPGMTGYELLKKIKESSAFREVPVVIMSSENINTRIDRCLEEGAEDYIVKPVKLSDVRRLKNYMMMMKDDRLIVKESGINKRKLSDGCDLSTSAPSLSSAKLCPQSSPAESSSSPVSLSSQSSQSPGHLQAPETESFPQSTSCLSSGNSSPAPVTQVSHCDSALIISSSPDIDSTVSAGIDSSSDERRSDQCFRLSYVVVTLAGVFLVAHNII